MPIPDKLFAYSFGGEKNSHSYEGVTLADSYAINILATLQLAPQDVVMDLGAGRGTEADFIETHFCCEVVRTDISLAGLQAQDRSKKKILCSADCLPVANQTFDFIHNKDVAVHFADLDKVFSEVKRVLKTGGTFLITTGTISKNFAQIYFSFTPEQQFGMSKMSTFEVVSEYLELAAHPEELLASINQDNSLFVRVSPPYFKINRDMIVDVAQKNHLHLLREESWEPTDSEKSSTWNQGVRSVLLFQK